MINKSYDEIMKHQAICLEKISKLHDNALSIILCDNDIVMYEHAYYFMVVCGYGVSYKIVIFIKDDIITEIQDHLME